MTIWIPEAQAVPSGVGSYRAARPAVRLLQGRSKPRVRVVRGYADCLLQISARARAVPPHCSYSMRMSEDSHSAYGVNWYHGARAVHRAAHMLFQLGTMMTKVSVFCFESAWVSVGLKRSALRNAGHSGLCVSRGRAGLRIPCRLDMRGQLAREFRRARRVRPCNVSPPTQRHIHYTYDV